MHAQGTGRRIALRLARHLSLGRVRTFQSLALRDYRLLWLGMAGTSMGQWLDQVARSWLIYELTDSPLMLGAVGAMRAVPMLLFGVVAGVVADQYGRKAQLIIAQLTNVCFNLILATLVATRLVQPWHVFVSAFLTGTVQAFQLPARQALIYDLVGKEYLLNAVALNSVVFNLMRSVGPAVAGFLIALVGIDGSYYAQATLFLLATVWTIQIRVPAEEKQPRRQGPPCAASSPAPGKGSNASLTID
jgi:MFS family permease